MGLCVPTWDLHQFPKFPGMTKTEGQDLNDLMMADLRWRAIMKNTVECMVDVHGYLVASLEGLYWGTSSRGDLGAPTKARTTQTSPPQAG